MSNKMADRGRNLKIRKTKRIILLSVEGKTETEYFKSFSGRNKNYKIKFTKGNQTDILNLYSNLKEEIKENKLKFSDGDMAFCVFDTDTDVNKNKQIKKILNKSDKISIITSSPCIEVWFYLHFKDWEKYVTSNQIVKELKKIFSGYTKGGFIPSEIFENEEVAIKRAKKLEERHLKNKINIDSVEANPHSSIYKIIEEFNKEI